MPRAWITGAAGLIGRYLVETKSSAAAQFQIFPLSRKAIDLTNFAAIDRRFALDLPDVIIHCAAMSKTPACQSDPKMAATVNIDVTKHLANLAAERRFIFFSTDLVFDGRKGNYLEDDARNPLSVYGETKAAAEDAVLKNPRHTVVRTSLNSGASLSGTSAYNEQWRGAWERGQTLDLFVDEFRSPIPACVTAYAVWELAAQNATGLFQLAGAEKLSRYEMGRLAAERHRELNPKINPGSAKAYQGAPRPPDTSMICDKIQKILSFPLPGLTEYLRAHPEEPY